MTIEQAIDVLTQVAAMHVGVLKDHETAQLALRTIRNALNSEKKSKEESRDAEPLVKAAG